MAAIQPIENFINVNLSNSELANMFRVVDKVTDEKVIEFEGEKTVLRKETLHPVKSVTKILDSYDAAVLAEKIARDRDTVRTGITVQKPGSKRVDDLIAYYATQEGKDDGDKVSAFEISDDEIARFCAMTAKEVDCE